MFWPLASLTALTAMCSAPAVVPYVDVSLYEGRWYQVYSDFSVQATFENNSYCVTADYGMNANGSLSVLNSETQYNVDGPVRIIHGYAEPANVSNPDGAFTVILETANFPAPYWILQLGPVVNGSYSYSVVSDPFRLTLFVLARNVTDFYANYNASVVDWLYTNGFDKLWNEPIETVQEGCTYDV